MARNKYPGRCYCCGKWIEASQARAAKDAGLVVVYGYSDDNVELWREKYGAVMDSPYTSESFGGYSYTKANGAGDSTGSGGWQAAFRARLNPYRKPRGI